MAEQDERGVERKSRIRRSAKPRSEESDEMKGLKASRLGGKPTGSAFIGEHKVASGDTLSGIALQYYRSAAKEKWMAIYEANKGLIGDNPSLIRPGQVLKIPKLPE